MANFSLENLIEFRHQLHRYPNLSGMEQDTQKAIISFLSDISADETIVDIGGYGILYVYDSGKPGPVLLFRADIDALPIPENSEIAYKSEVSGIAHLCGHDGHIAILCGFANYVNNNRPNIGKLVLLFQPAEETGQGARLVIEDLKLRGIMPDISVALHNLPGFKINTVYSCESVFSSASTGFILNLKGLPSHAAYPENGKNPDLCVAELVNRFNKISQDFEFDDFVLLTIIHINLGEVAFGTCPGEAVIMLTIRSYLNEDMIKLKNTVETLADEVCNKHEIKYSFHYTEDFPASINSVDNVSVLKKVCVENNISYCDLDLPFRWSEDFGHFSKVSKSLLFGIGAGIDHPQLHNENYDFPDEIIKTGISVFKGIYKEILKSDE